MTTTLLPGANKGLGYEAAKRLVLPGHEVCLGARDAAARRRPLGPLLARFVQLDVTDAASVEAAAALVAKTGGFLRGPRE